MGKGRGLILQQAVVGVNVIYVLARDQLMLHKNGGRNGASIQDFQANMDQIVTISLRKICNRSDESGIWFSQFRSSFGRGILPHDNTTFPPASFLKCTQRAQGAGVIDCPHDHALRGVRPQVPARCFQALAKTSVAIQVR